MTISDSRTLWTDTAAPDPELAAALRTLFTSFGVLDRYGLTELHEHFPQGAGEILSEHVDPSTRTLTTRPVPLSEASGPATSWRFNGPDATPIPLQVCPGHGDK